MPLNIIEESKKEFDERLIKIDWEKYYKDRPFNPSALAMYKWAPIAIGAHLYLSLIHI